MIRHTLLLIFRNFRRFKSTFFINLIGLSSGLACTLLIYLWVRDEISIDQFATNGNRIYHAWEHRVKADGIWTASSTSAPLAEALVADMPEVEFACGSTWTQSFTMSVDEKVMKVRGRYSGKDFFNIFTYSVIQGEASKVLTNKNAIVISASLANKLFNTTENVVGKTITLERRDEFVVTGVFQDVPANISEPFEFVLSFEKYTENNQWTQYWGNTGTQTFVLLREGVNEEDFNKKIANYVSVKTRNEITYRTLFLKKYSDIYLYGKYQDGKPAGGRITYVKLFSIIAVFILLIACINFMNLSTAKASRRIREVGIKKAVGAGRRTLVMQYLGESLLMSFLSMAFAFLAVDLLMSRFNELTGKQLELQMDGNLLLISLVIWLVAGVMAGSYPALYLSGFSPAAVLKGKLNTSLGELWARKGLVVFQFVLSVILIVSVLVVHRQIEFVGSTDLGYDRENILSFYREGKIRGNWQSMETLLTEIKNIPGVVNASTISHNMTGHNSGTWGLRWEGRDPEDRTEFENVTVSHDMMETLGIQMAAGRSFSRNYPADTASIVISETGIKFMGLKDPVGVTVNLWGKDMRIIGVSKDFHYESLHEKLKPLFFRLAPNDTYLVMVKLAPGTEPETIARLQQLYQKFNPGFSFDYSLLADRYHSQYFAEQRVAKLSRYFAGLAILISCLGLFGLASFTAERRLKEIGIRKVLGASEFRIVSLLSKDFTRMVLVAILLALPVSYFIARSWLDNFAFKIELEWWYFLTAGAMALVIAWLTVGSQAFRAARINPTRCLKDE
jgi:putative ABC transport system permease protein